jgi:uncharacterized protein
MILGPTNTPAFQRLHGHRDASPLADPNDVARDLLDNLGNGPTYPPGPPLFAAITRREAVNRMTQGTARLHD